MRDDIKSIYASAWTFAWSLDNMAIGPLHTIRIMTGHFWRALERMKLQ